MGFKLDKDFKDTYRDFFGANYGSGGSGGSSTLPEPPDIDLPEFTGGGYAGLEDYINSGSWKVKPVESTDPAIARQQSRAVSEGIQAGEGAGQQFLSSSGLSGGSTGGASMMGYLRAVGAIGGSGRADEIGLAESGRLTDLAEANALREFAGRKGLMDADLARFNAEMARYEQMINTRTINDELDFRDKQYDDAKDLQEDAAAAADGGPMYTSPGGRRRPMYGPRSKDGLYQPWLNERGSY